MIFELLIELSKAVLFGVFGILPNYESHPLPDWVMTNITEVFRVVGLIIELPLVRVGYVYFKILLIFFSTIWLWNIFLKILSTIPLFGGLKQWQITANKFKQ